MSSKAAFWKWAAIGAVASALLIVGQARSQGGLDGLLQVGETSALRPLIEAELGEVPLSPGPGHDGQIYYAIGLDLNGDEVGPLLDHAGYRYRRILYPLVASGFGLFGGQALLIGMVLVSIASASVATGAVAYVARSRGRSDWWALAVILNPGVWLSVRLLTSDMIALAAMMIGLLAVVTGARWAAASFALSGLAKDVYLVTPAGLSISRERRRWPLIAIPLAALMGWMAWLTFSLGEGFTPRGNLALPLMGIMEASQNWPNLESEEVFYLVFGLLSVAAGLVYGVFRRSWLRWPILGWSALGIISSSWVWDLGNNAARVFAPIAVLLAIAVSQTPTDSVERVGARLKTAPE